MNNYII